MRRIMPWLAMLLATLPGCGGGERPSFSPTASTGPGGSTAGPREPARPSTEVAIPRNIETH